MRGQWWRRGVVLGPMLLAGCSSSEPVSVARVEVTPATISVPASEYVQFAARLLDADGGALKGRIVKWTVERPEIAFIDPVGRVITNAPGVTQVRATSEGQVGVATLTVLPAAVAYVGVIPSSVTVAVGGTRQLNTLVLDSRGDLITGREVTWSTSAPDIATVSSSGIVTALSTGAATITVAVEGKSATSAVTVVDATTVPTIGSIVPDVLVPGEALTIRGANLAGADVPVVTLGGVSVPFVSVTPTRLDLVVPCVARGPATLVIEAFGRSATRQLDVSTRQVSLAVGQVLITTSPTESRCNELLSQGETGKYLVTVFSNAPSANAFTTFSLRGGAASLTASVARPAEGRSDAFPQRDTRNLRTRMHGAMLEHSRAEYARLRVTEGARPMTRGRVTGAPPVVGERRSLRYTLFRSCNDASQRIGVRAVHVGERAVVWEDTTNSLRADRVPSLNAVYRRLVTLFDTEQYDVVKQYFGDPLLRDAETDADGRIHMVFTQRLNTSFVAAYVTPCDQYSAAGVPGSNEGEYLYGFVPVSTTSNPTDELAVDGWGAFMTHVVIHEVKHIASTAARVRSAATALEEAWLEEGTAGHAEELWARDRMHRNSWKSNAGFGTAGGGGVFCDFHVADAACLASDPLRRPSGGVSDLFDRTREKIAQPSNYSPFGDASGEDPGGFYGTAWSFIRYVVDRYATTEESFYTALTNSMTGGVANLSGVAGVPMDRLLGGWGLALYADDLPGFVGNRDTDVPSWNTRSIYAGLYASPFWRNRWSDPMLLKPIPRQAGNFVSGGTVRGGAHAFYEISGPFPPSQVLDLRDSGSALASPTLRLAVLRLQ